MLIDFVSMVGEIALIVTTSTLLAELARGRLRKKLYAFAQDAHGFVSGDTVLDWFHVTMVLKAMRHLALGASNAAGTAQPGRDRAARDMCGAPWCRPPVAWVA